MRIVERCLTAIPDPDERSPYVWGLIECMRKLGDSVAGLRLRHFENSELHRFRQRHYQTVLILLPHLRGEHTVGTTVLDPYTCFTDPDPHFFYCTNPGPDLGKKKRGCSKAFVKYWGGNFFVNKKVGTRYWILLNRTFFMVPEIF